MTKIAILGPESSGKTTIAKWIEKNYKINLIHEYARQYLEGKIDANYDFIDFIDISYFQLTQIITHWNHSFIADTEGIVLSIWSEEKFHFTPKSIKKFINKYRFDYYILCPPNIPWKADPLRENEHDRYRLFDLYENELKKHDLNYFILNSSIFEERTEQVKSILKNDNNLNRILESMR